MRQRLRRLSVLLLASAITAAAAPMYFGGFMTGPQEEPPNASPGIGETRVTIDPIAHLLRVEVWYSGLIGPTVTASHIHVINVPGDANMADTLGPVATTTPSFPGFPSGTSGVYDMSFDTTLASTFRAGFITAQGGLPEAEAALFQGIIDGRAYLNIHSNTYPGGEIRVFLEPVPEPATAGMAVTALAGLALLRYRKNRS